MPLEAGGCIAVAEPKRSRESLSYRAGSRPGVEPGVESLRPQAEGIAPPRSPRRHASSGIGVSVCKLQQHLVITVTGMENRSYN
jgi:hypothetical protein